VKDGTITGTFTEFVVEHERRLRAALTAALGVDVGRDATADALAYAWEHWDRISAMENPGAYLFVVGRDRGRRMLRRRQVVLPGIRADELPWVEPALPSALASLTETQRMVAMLIDGYDWTMAEVASMLGITKSSVQTHHDRALDKLRQKLKVDQP
jgi:RNA polymerase sigma factor (sigma-70 family)